MKIPNKEKQVTVINPKVTVQSAYGLEISAPSDSESSSEEKFPKKLSKGKQSKFSITKKEKKFGKKR